MPNSLYPFRPEKEIPSTKYFWAARKMITTGTSEQTEAAMINA
jgi:hypothetical protein